MSAPKIKDRKFKLFYGTMFFSAIIPSLNYIFPFLPTSFLGFNWSGWAWITMLSVTLIVFPTKQKNKFPIFVWLPWVIYLFIYVFLDFSFFGFQLTLQYVLPIIVGIRASKFVYDENKISWVFYWFFRLCLLYIALFAVGHIFRQGVTAAVASVPMLLSILECVLLAMYFKTKKLKYILSAGVLFVVPILDVTRMGILVFLLGFIIHFGNSNLLSKVLYSISGAIFALIIFNTQAFQEKTFYEGKGDLNDLNIDYYNNESVNNSGRSALFEALNAGLKENIFFGNGPRADLEALAYSGSTLTEVHNDYLSVRYNYGQFGVSLLIIGFIGNFILVYFKVVKMAFSIFLKGVILTLFVGFMLFMYSDNILKYTVFYPNIFFAMIGILYSIDFYKKELDFRFK